MNRVFDFIAQATEEEKLMFASDINTLILDMYYARYWKEDVWSYERSGHNLALEVNQLRGNSVLDVGCGNNLFKDHIYYLHGIDVFNEKADQTISLAQFQSENPKVQYDVILALDSVNTGKKADILYSFDQLDKLTKPGGHQFWRVNTAPPTSEFPLLGLVEFFEWDEKFINELADCNGYQVKELCEEKNNDGETRLFFCFYKY
jgi:hypothetical protein